MRDRDVIVAEEVLFQKWLPLGAVEQIYGGLGRFIFSTSVDIILQSLSLILDIVLFLFYWESRQQKLDL